MLADSKAYNGFAVDDLERAREFYEETLGIGTEILDEENGLMVLKLAGGRDTLVYIKEDHVPATYTVLNFPVDDVEATVDGLVGARRQLRALRPVPPGRARHRHRGRPPRRLVPRPCRQHPLGAGAAGRVVRGAKSRPARLRARKIFKVGPICAPSVRPSDLALVAMIYRRELIAHFKWLEGSK